jgi:HK97 family phage major capsid protein
MNRRKKMLVLPHMRARKLVIGLGMVVAAVLWLALVAVAVHHGGGLLSHAGPLAALLPLALLGTVLPETEFQEKVLKGVEEMQTQQKDMRSGIEKVSSELDRSDKEVKKALEEFTRVKNDVEKGKEVMNSFDAAMKAMEKVQKAIALNARSSWRDPVEKALSDEGFRTFLNAAARASAFPAEYKRLPAEWQKLLEEGNAKQKALTGVDTSLGQATIPSEWFKTIYDLLIEYGQWNQLDVIQVGARTNLVPVATARPNFYWIGAGTGGVGESSAITEGSFTGDSVTLSIQTLAVYLLVARELLADSSVDMSAYLLKQLLQSLSFGLDTVAFIGTGGANQTNAGYYGIFNAASVNTQLAATAGAGNTTIEATQLEDWQRCMLTVSQQVLMRNPRWFLNPQVLIRSLAVRDKNGRPLFQTYTEAPMPGGIGSILGAPIVPVAVGPTTNAAGATPAVFGDPQGQAVGIRSDMEFATSDDIKFAENMRAFRGLCRAGVIPKTKAASTTLKPFAVLTLAAA